MVALIRVYLISHFAMVVWQCGVRIPVDVARALIGDVPVQASGHLANVGVADVDDASRSKRQLDTPAKWRGEWMYGGVGRSLGSDSKGRGA
jgi:hypothetical protein